MVPRRARERSRSGFQPVTRAASAIATDSLGAPSPTTLTAPRFRTFHDRPPGCGRLLRPCATSCNDAIAAGPRHRGWAATRSMLSAPAMLDLTDVTLRIAGRPLLEGANLHIPAATRLALVGRNGTGKSTLLRLIAGELQPDQGEVRMPTSLKIGMVRQEAPGGDMTPLQAVLAADTLRESLLAEAKAATDPVRIAEVHQRLIEIGADAAPSRAARILKGLGFDDDAQAQPLSSFSGGWRMRVALAGVLFLEPDLLLLDEPTNHLDLEAAIWLEEHLRRYPRTLILVSHDRDFLDSVPQKTCHLECRRLSTCVCAWPGWPPTFPTECWSARLIPWPSCCPTALISGMNWTVTSVATISMRAPMLALSSRPQVSRKIASACQRRAARSRI